ncbi:MAG: ABC transporter permease [Treponema sp.]|nr:ABC transporter permease [Treponema sp.]
MKEVFGALLRDRVGRWGLFGVGLVILMALTASSIAPFDPLEVNTQLRFAPPGEGHLFGTDYLGRDVFSRILYGARVSIFVGLISVSIGAGFGFLIGVISGYIGGRIDNLIMRFMDVLFAFPSILLALLIVSVLGSDIRNTMIAIGIVFMPVFTRTVRASVITVKNMDYVQNAKTVGVRPVWVIIRHIIPNTLSPFLVQITLALSSAILTESTLSFLGLGIQPPNPSWGSMLSESRSLMELAPWTAIFPAVFIIMTILSFNILGDSLRDVLDPKLKI